MKQFRLSLLTPKGTIVNNLECIEAKIPTSRGEIDVLPEHTHLLTQLAPGILTVINSMGTRHFSVTAGICRVLKDKITLTSFASEESKQIDVERAKSAKSKALSRLSGKDSLSDIELIKFRRKLERAELRIRLANLK